MRQFASALLLTGQLANAFAGLGFDYNIGNGYTIGDSHGFYMNDHRPQTAQNAHDHIIGYDSVKPYSDADWSTNSANFSTAATNIKTQIQTISDARSLYIENVMNIRANRFDDMQEDNLRKVSAPFDLQFDLLTLEIADVNKAKGYAEADANSAWTDLQERMQDYLLDREEALDTETNRVIRVLERAVDDKKDAGDVLYAMRLDWLQGVYISGTTVTFDEDVYDMHVYDDEFDIFTYDVGHGKGHGHTNQGYMGNKRFDNQGFVVGAGLGSPLKTLRGKPRPVDGKVRRYDKATLGGRDYQRGVDIGRRRGAFGYDEEAAITDFTNKPRSRRPSRRAPPKSSRKYAARPNRQRRPPRRSPQYQRDYNSQGYNAPKKSYAPPRQPSYERIQPARPMRELTSRRPAGYGRKAEEQDDKYDLQTSSDGYGYVV